jgi:hypothetical protein
MATTVKPIKKKKPGHHDRPSRAVITGVFALDNRKVTPADLHRAGVAAAAAFRASLEGCNPPYSMAEVHVEVDYSYTMTHRTFTA